ncbi:hypothetical protein SLA2020_439370 [Shorea laevis]
MPVPILCVDRWRISEITSPSHQDADSLHHTQVLSSPDAAMSLCSRVHSYGRGRHGVASLSPMKMCRGFARATAVRTLRALCRIHTALLHLPL